MKVGRWLGLVAIYPRSGKIDRMIEPPSPRTFWVHDLIDVSADETQLFAIRVDVVRERGGGRFDYSFGSFDLATLAWRPLTP
ncbi:MAG: hypothetical protein WKG00_22115 [Polyangiaceae bacterium]